MPASKKSSKKKTTKEKRSAKRHAQEILGELPHFDGLNIKLEPSKQTTKRKRPKLNFTYEVTDHKALEKDLEIKKKIAAMITPVAAPASLDHYLSVSDPSNAIRNVRMVFLEHLIQTAHLTGQDVNEALLDSDRIKAFLEGLELSDSERIEHAKGFFFNSILMFAKLPLDPRREIAFMIEALEQVQKALPKRKPGRKEDDSLMRAWRRIDFDKMSHREAYRLYCIENGIEAFDKNAFIVFQGNIRKKRSQESQKQAKKTVAAKTKQRRQNSGS